MYEATPLTSFANLNASFGKLVLKKTLTGFYTEVSSINQRLDSCDQRRPNLVTFDEPSIGHGLKHQIQTDLVHDPKGACRHSGGLGPRKIDLGRVGNAPIEQFESRSQYRLEHCIEDIAAVFDCLDDGGLADLYGESSESIEGFLSRLWTGRDIHHGGFPNRHVEVKVGVTLWGFDVS